jgi:subtilisin-like proprotein convertase family protein
MADLIAGDSSTIYSLAINSSASSSIDYFGDTDWWRVSLTGGFGYQAWVEGWSSGGGTLFDPYLAVYNSAGVLQLYSDDISLSNYDSYLSGVPSVSGTFYLSAEESGDSATGTYTITLWQDQLASTASAATIPVNSLVTDRIGWQSDTSDWYSVTLTAGTLYQFDLVGTAGDGALVGLTLADPWLAIRSSAGVLIAANDDSGVGANSRIFYTPTVSGTYFLDAQALLSSSYGIYSLIVNSTPAGSSITVGSNVTGTVGFSGDTNLHSVALTAGVTYGFALDGTTLVDPFMEILDYYGAVVDYDDDSGPGLGAYLAFTPTTSGTYFLAARESGNNATGSYSAKVWQIPTISIANSSVLEGNSGTTNLVFTLTLSAASSVDVTVTASTSGTATATVSVDYVSRSSNIIFSAGQTSATFTVQVLGDTIFEPTEALHVLLSHPVGAVLGNSDAYGFITDNDSPYILPADPLLKYQWYLYPTTGINVFPVWTDYTGKGVRVAVFDQGIDPSHPDLNGNLLTSLGRNASNLSAGGAPILSTDNHGTQVAGTIAAECNGEGVVGVAYGASLVSIYSRLTIPEIANAFSYAGNFDVLNNSWGFAPQGTNYYALYGNWAFADNFLTSAFSAAGLALANLAATGRSGLGTVVVQSAGNSFSLGDDTNLHNFQNSQYIITVAATDYAGNVTSYSSPGASVLVAAPGGGGTDLFSNIVTTDRVGTAGTYPSDYASTAGTSFSAPIVSGIVALMLEANPNLGYRDVQEILAYSAQKTAPTSNDWSYNGASNWNGGGLHYDALDHNLGYGLVDALAAVRLAETWGSASHTTANRQQVTLSHNPALAIPDNTGSAAYDSILVNQSIDVERVEVTLKVTHPFIGDLSVLLRSPSGTTSFLLWRPQQNALSAYGTSQDNIHFTFNTVLNWGESSLGAWDLAIFDYDTGYVGKFDSWTLNLIGKPASADDTYIYTNEFSESRADQAARAALSDSGGIDTLNAAAVTANLILNLTPGGVSTIDGQSLTIAVGTVIENAYGGDGNDNITGNDSANVLYGMRGNDTLNGGAGADIFNGGAGVDTAVYAGLFRKHQLAGNPMTSASITGPEGTDSLTGIEKLSFVDGSKNYDPHAHVAQVLRLYDATLGRMPDALGLNNWAAQLDAGAVLSNVALGFTNSQEFKNTYGSLNSSQFVSQLYLNVLNRAADSTGLTHWVNVLNSGTTRGEVVVGFSESQENVNNHLIHTNAGIWDINETAGTVARLYWGTLGRAPDAAGLINWVGAIDGGMTFGAVANGFTNSPEFKNTYESLSNKQFANQLYLNVLNRPADAAGLANWTNTLNAGTSRGDVTLGFTESTEYQIKMIGLIDQGITIL